MNGKLTYPFFQCGLGSSIILPREVSSQESSCLSSSSQREGNVDFGLSGTKGWKVEVVFGIEDEDRSRGREWSSIRMRGIVFKDK